MNPRPGGIWRHKQEGWIAEVENIILSDTTYPSIVVKEGNRQILMHLHTFLDNFEQEHPRSVLVDLSPKEIGWIYDIAWDEAQSDRSAGIESDPIAVELVAKLRNLL